MRGIGIEINPSKERKRTEKVEIFISEDLHQLTSAAASQDTFWRVHDVIFLTLRTCRENSSYQIKKWQDNPLVQQGTVFRG